MGSPRGRNRCEGCAQFDSPHSSGQCCGSGRTVTVGQHERCRRCQIERQGAPGQVADEPPALQWFLGGIPGSRRRGSAVPNPAGLNSCGAVTDPNALELALFFMPADG